MSSSAKSEIAELRERIIRLEQRIEALEKMVMAQNDIHERYFKVILLLISAILGLVGVKTLIQ